METGVSLAKTNLLEQLEALGSPQVSLSLSQPLTHMQSHISKMESVFNHFLSLCEQTEPPSQQHVQIQKELWRIQDVMEALAKNKPQRTTDTGFLGSKPISNLQKNEVSLTSTLWIKKNTR